ncbi:MAG: single-stranded-DNA-specific exonuclease RecJ [Candidatus Pacebacteria bacterium]|nr:single-stranded-DNA-specific exonuclease RecJ [Candidatus Paceibacterota bacterium]
MEKKIIFGEELPNEIKKEFQPYPELLGELLFYREIKTRAEADRFLNPDYDKETHNPFLIKGMEKAVKRILTAIEKNQKIIIYSDYDADGIPGAVILSDFFKKIGFLNFQNYIPNRLKEGYGLNLPAIEKFAGEQADILITVDCGIADVEETKLAAQNGIDVIITDHHLVNGELPPAFAILNSKQEDDNYPDDMLCGAGVVYKLIQALIQKGDFDLAQGWEKWLLDLVGLATVADMVPLKNENRIFAKYGLLVMRKSPRLGLMKMLRKMGTNQKKLAEDDIGFMIAPRINAASRVGDPMTAFDLLAARDEMEADGLACQLNKLNNQRKTLVATAVRRAKKKIKERETKEVIITGDSDWNIGISGLIASSLQNEYQKPCFVWGTDENDNYCGSCRSDNTDLMELMGLVEEGFFSHWGGHKNAGGFGIVSEHIHFFEEKILEAFEKIEDKETDEKIFVDKKLLLDDVNWENYKLIEKLAPFGMGNAKPLFLFENVEPKGARIFGKTKNHLELTFQNSRGGKIKAIDFFSDYIKDGEPNLKARQKINLLANFDKNSFNGANELRLRVFGIL